MDAMKDDQLEAMRNDPLKKRSYDCHLRLSGLIRGTFQAREQRDVHEWLSRFRLKQSADGLHPQQIRLQAVQLWAIQGAL